MTESYEKITKLLRLAERSTGPEAELALMRAQKLATEMQVDLAIIDTTEGEMQKREEMSKSDLLADGKIKAHLVCALAGILQDHFRVKVCWQSYVPPGGTRRVSFIGRKSDTAFAEYLFNWLKDHFQREWESELKKPGKPGRRRTQLSFYFGMAQGLGAKLRAEKIKAEDSRIAEIAQERPSEGGGFGNPLMAHAEKNTRKQYQLAVINEADELAKAYREFVPRARSYSGGRGSSAVARDAGYAAGQRTRIPGAPLNNRTNSALR